MDHFLFYCGDDATMSQKLREVASGLWGEVTETSAGPFTLQRPTTNHRGNAGDTRSIPGAISGYVRLDGLSPEESADAHPEAGHTRAFLKAVVEQQSWPLDHRWTGSFAAVGYSSARRALVLCNDLLGYLPLYYCFEAGGVVGSTSLIALNRCVRHLADPVGIVQRLTADCANFGGRTLIESVARLLPGEWLQITVPGLRQDFRYDNTLCKDLLPLDLEGSALETWICLNRETQLAIADSGPVHVAMSGGWVWRFWCRLDKVVQAISLPNILA